MRGRHPVSTALRSWASGLAALALDRQDAREQDAVIVEGRRAILLHLPLGRGEEPGGLLGLAGLPEADRDDRRQQGEGLVGAVDAEEFGGRGGGRAVQPDDPVGLVIVEAQPGVDDRDD